MSKSMQIKAGTTGHYQAIIIISIISQAIVVIIRINVQSVPVYGTHVDKRFAVSTVEVKGASTLAVAVRTLVADSIVLTWIKHAARVYIRVTVLVIVVVGAITVCQFTVRPAGGVTLVQCYTVLTART